MFGRSWESGEATIVAIESKASGSGDTSGKRFAADVTTPGAAPFRTVLSEPRIATDFWPPDVGAVVRVLVDVRRQQAKFDKDDETISFKAYKRRAADAFAATARAAPGTTPER